MSGKNRERSNEDNKKVDVNRSRQCRKAEPGRISRHTKRPRKWIPKAPRVSTTSSRVFGAFPSFAPELGSLGNELRNFFGSDAPDATWPLRFSASLRCCSAFRFRSFSASFLWFSICIVLCFKDDPPDEIGDTEMGGRSLGLEAMSGTFLSSKILISFFPISSEPLMSLMSFRSLISSSSSTFFFFSFFFSSLTGSWSGRGGRSEEEERSRTKGGSEEEREGKAARGDSEGISGLSSLWFSLCPSWSSSWPLWAMGMGED